MAKVAKPITRLFGTGPVRSTAEIDQNFKILFREDRGRATLVHGLGFPVDDESERRGAVGGDEADGCAGRVDRFGGRETLRVADGAEDAAPVGVFAVQGRLDQGVAGDGGGDELGVRKGGRVDDSDPDELGGAFAVPHDELGELLREVREHLLHGFPVLGRRRVDGLAAGGTVGEDGEGVVGACAAVYADGVEGAVDGVGEERSESCGWDGSVGAEDTEERGHVWMDHAGAFGHSCYRIGDGRRGGESECPGEELGESVGRAYRSGGRQP